MLKTQKIVMLTAILLSGCATNNYAKEADKLADGMGLSVGNIANQIGEYSIEESYKCYDITLDAVTRFNTGSGGYRDGGIYKHKMSYLQVLQLSSSVWFNKYQRLAGPDRVKKDAQKQIFTGWRVGGSVKTFTARNARCIDPVISAVETLKAGS